MHMKLTTTLLILLCSNSLLAQIGLTHRTFIDSTRGRVLNTTLLYPAKSDSLDSYGANRVFKGFKASLHAELRSDIKLPLIVLIHGTSGNWKNLTWLGAPIAGKGAIVVAANHEGSTTGDATPASVIRMWQQPEDVSFLLDRVFASEFYEFIDTNKVIVIGSSLGGYTALALSGAILRFEEYKQFCMDNEDASTKYFRPALDELDENFYKKANQAHLDQRIRLAIALVPGFVEVMNFAAFTTVTTPALIVGASLDENLPPATHYKPFIGEFPAAWKYIEIKDATHYSFLQECKDGAWQILAEENAEFACLEKGAKTREAIHREVIDEIEKFMIANFHSN
jgi:predicted dienelactone hydrolase